MPELIIAFVTGLTTGGLSCLAVQGGLLASSLASQIENDLSVGSSTGNPKIAQPIFWFLLSKLLTYTILGFLLGWVGSILSLSITSRAIMQIAIGLFMVGQALRLLNVHPFFRYFNIEPPKFITRFIRRKSKHGSRMITPLFMGALTVLIPCGITQIMMASAVGSGNPITGAALMFFFTLGTSPVFFAIAYFTTRLGEKLEKYFMKFVGVSVLILGIIGIASGLNIIGVPSTIRNVISPSSNNQQILMEKDVDPETISRQDTNMMDIQEVVITVQNTGYSPQISHAKAGVPVTLVLESSDVYSCSLAFVIQSLNIQVLLEPTGRQTIDLPAQPAGSELPFACSMGMYTGIIVFDL